MAGKLDDTRLDKKIRWAKDHPIIVFVLVVGVAVIALGQVTGALESITKFAEKLFGQAEPREQVKDSRIAPPVNSDSEAADHTDHGGTPRESDDVSKEENSSGPHLTPPTSVDDTPSKDHTESSQDFASWKIKVYHFKNWGGSTEEQKLGERFSDIILDELLKRHLDVRKQLTAAEDGDPFDVIGVRRGRHRRRISRAGTFLFGWWLRRGQ